MSFLDAIKALKRFLGGQPEQQPERQQPSAPPVSSQPLGKLSTTKTATPTSQPEPPQSGQGQPTAKTTTAKPSPPRPAARQTQQPLPKSSQTAAPAVSKAQPVVARQTQAIQKMQIMLGLDFGTAFTKAVIRERRACYAVPFNPPGEKNNYLLPGEMQIGPDERCRLSWEEGVFSVKNMKMKLLERQDSHENLVYAAAFLSLAMRHCRDWLITEHQAIYKGVELDWHINIGMPTASYHDQELMEKYRLITLVGWALSLHDQPLTLPEAEAVFKSVSQRLIHSSQEVIAFKAGMIHPKKIGLFPEFVAQIVGYVRSPLRQPDLHILMDVGAGTVDLSMFNVHKNTEDEDCFPIFTKDVQPLGTQFLCRHRIQQTGKPTRLVPESVDKVPSKTDFSSLLGLSPQQLATIDKPFEKRIRNQLKDQLTDVKEKRYPDSPLFKTGVPLFLCGGGANVDFYTDIIASIEAKTDHAKRIRRKLLPKPTDLIAPGLNPAEYDRLSVAYGLTFDAFDIGQIILSSDISDVDPSPSNAPKPTSPVDKELV